VSVAAVPASVVVMLHVVMQCVVIQDVVMDEIAAMIVCVTAQAEPSQRIRSPHQTCTYELIRRQYLYVGNEVNKISGRRGSSGRSYINTSKLTTAFLHASSACYSQWRMVLTPALPPKLLFLSLTVAYRNCILAHG
jgi:hypothetical protein